MYHEMAAGTMLPANSSCPLCDNLAHRIADAKTDAMSFVCRICGRFCISEEAFTFLQHLKNEQSRDRYKLSYVMRTASERVFGKRHLASSPMYRLEDIQTMFDWPAVSIQEKFNLLLKYLGRLSEFPGDCKEFDSDNDYSILCAKNFQENEFYLQSLAEQGLVILESPYTGKSETRFTVSAKGWMELERIEHSGGESSNAFIAMWFDPKRSKIDAAINRAITNSGYIPIRIDRVEHLNRIDDEIIARIRQSKFLVADFSGQRNGVYFEAGFMLGLGRPVIWICEKTELKDVHFDTRQYNTIDYTDTENLRIRLQTRIEANLGKGPHICS